MGGKCQQMYKEESALVDRLMMVFILKCYAFVGVFHFLFINCEFLLSIKLNTTNQSISQSISQ